jgi:predicted outer membrane repeat protein/parallel beta-helix repeat protein
MRFRIDAQLYTVNRDSSLRRSVLGLAIALALVSASTSAATIQVTTTGDSPAAGNCTFRQAVTAINAAAVSGTGCVASGVFGTSDTVTFAPGIVTIELGDVAANSVNITVNNDLTILGTGTGGVTIERPSGAANQFGVIRETSTQCTLTLNGLTINNGYSPLTTGGGGVYSAADLIVENSVIGGNSARAPGSGTTHGGGVSAYSVTLNNSSVSRNSQLGFGIGGGIYAKNVTVNSSIVSGNSALGSGGGIYATKEVTLSYSIVSDNSGLSGAGILAPTATVSGSTISGNTASGYGGGISAAVTMSNSTVSGNAAKSGGGLNSYISNITNSTISSNTSMNYGGGILGAKMTLNNSTVTNNATTTGKGGGLSVGYSEAVPLLSMTSTIVSGNNSNAGTYDIATKRSVTATGNHNLLGTTTSTIVLTSLTNEVGGNPMLGPLASNGGTTLTHALRPTSPAVHAGANPQGLLTDQRGSGFARETGGDTDIGAFELQDEIFANGFEVP